MGGNNSAGAGREEMEIGCCEFLILYVKYYISRKGRLG